MKRFFDEYPAFYNTSDTNPYPNRLNTRVDMLIKNNLEIIQNKNILDIACHDGRFSFAALKHGAAHVLCIDSNRKIIENGINNMKKYDIPDTKYNFIIGDIFQEIQKIKPNQIDTVFCFGFFYHIINHVFLLSQIRRLKPQYLILDTNIFVSDKPIMEILLEEKYGSTIANKDTKDHKTLVGVPSKSTIELMLENLKFNYKYLDWMNKELTDWQFLGDYKRGSRISLVAKLEYQTL